MLKRLLVAPLQQSEILPSPSSTVPFRRDIDFVDRRILHDRGTLLEQIEQQCAAPAARVGSWELVAQGEPPFYHHDLLANASMYRKSQLAIEHCYRLRERSPDTWVFWIHASNTDRIKQGYREIAELGKIPGRTDPKQNIFKLVARWVRDETKGRWVLTLDNLDDDTVLSTPKATALRVQAGGGDGQLRRPLSAYLPQSQNGVILITTRTRSVATKLVEPRDMILINLMTDTYAITLLKKKLDVSADDSDLRKLTSILEYIPLAIVQATAFIQ
jgi:hypothetical protein